MTLRFNVILIKNSDTKTIIKIRKLKKNKDKTSLPLAYEADGIKSIALVNNADLFIFVNITFELNGAARLLRRPSRAGF